MRIRTGGLVVVIMVSAVLFVSGSILSAGQEPADRQRPAFKSGVEAVTVDVGVVDKQGRPLPGLGPQDFVVSVAGQPRRVVSVEFVEAAPASRGGTPPRELVPVSTNEGGGAGRLFVFVVDQNTLDTTSARRVGTAASRFLDQLTFSDRSALIFLPVGNNVGFTWAHDKVREALKQAAGMGSLTMPTWEFGSLTEARDVSGRGQMALRTIAERECRSSTFASGGPSPAPLPGAGSSSGGSEPAPPAGGGAPSGEGGGAGGGTPTGGGGPTGGATAPRPSAASGELGTSPCLRNLQMAAEAAWRNVHTTSLASLAALRQVLSALQGVRGDKTIILISGGWPLDEHEETSLLSIVASDAAAARAKLFTVFVSATSFSADRRSMSSNPTADQFLYQGPLENLAAMTGGGWFRGDVGAEGVFDRLSRELGGYYRIGIEKDPTDASGKVRSLKVRVSRGGLTVRAREFFDVRTYEDRDWSARLDAALEAPVPATSVGLRMTSYLATNQDGAGRIRLVLVGEASRMQPGDAKLQLIVRDLKGGKVLEGEQPLGDVTSDPVPFSANVPLPPGSYIVRVAVMDGEGRVGSVDHRVDVQPVTLGSITAMGPLFVRVPPGAGAEPRLALDRVRQDERLAMEVDVEGDKARLANAAVTFEIAATADGPSLVQTSANLSAGSRDGSALAQALADVRVLPPGQYLVRAKIMSGGDSLGMLSRPFIVEGYAPARVVASDAAPGSPSPRSTIARVPAGAVQPFAVGQALAPQVLGAFLDRVAARPDAASGAARQLLARARTQELRTLDVADASSAEGPVGAFVRGLALLAQDKLDPAADSFRNAMRASPDFYPAMVYLGACYAAGGNDKQAAGAWRTALIKEGDTPALHLWLTDALLRQGRTDEALTAIDRARAQWPDDNALARRFVAAALVEGRTTEGLQALDQLLAAKADDESSLALGLLTLYEAFVDRHPVESIESDRARMTRLAAAYRARGGPAQALVDTWVSAAVPK